ncbi:MAG TPA: cupin domain-containing protein [Stellaceae bacterium]|nr:cupin domain-containing protein [Stellaceae bacterium]
MLPGVSLKVLQRSDGPLPGYETVILELEIEAGTMVGRHAHPGIESTYVVEGTAELLVDGQPARLLKRGDAFQIPPNLPHSVNVGNCKAKACSTLIVEKEKSLVSAL